MNGTQNDTKVASTPSSAEKPRKKWLAPLIIFGSIAVIAVAAATFFFIWEQGKVSAPVCKGTIAEPEKLTSSQKISKDYEEGKIDVNTYFTQLFYCEYNTAKLDDKYKSDYEGFTSSENKKLNDLIEKHGDDIDENMIKAYAEKLNMADVKIVCRDNNSPSVGSKAYKASGYNIKTLTNSANVEKTTETTTATEATISEEELAKQDIQNHELDRVILSQSENFLIWYTTIGEDAVTTEEAQSIAEGLEDTIARYNQLFDLEFDYSPAIEWSISTNYKEAVKVLENNSISKSFLNTAMNVYIYNSGSEGPAASHNKISSDGLSQAIAKFLDDGYVAYPYIHINRQAFNDEERLQQLYNHELFHEYQDIYARELGADYSTAPMVYSDATANMASALAAEYNTTSSFLNDWASQYFANDNTNLQSITDSVSYGYGAFPYFYAYSQEVEGWAEPLMYAHTKENPYQYLHDATEHEDMLKIADRLSDYLLTNDFDNNALVSYSTVRTEDVLFKHTFDDGTVHPGSYVMYEIKNDVSFEAENTNPEYVTLNLYGYKNGRFTKITSGSEKLKADTATYPRYEKFFLTITNGSPVRTGSYKIVTTQSELAPNKEFETTFGNYKINIEMDLTVAGITTRTVSQGIIDEIHQKEYLETTITTGDTITLDSYSYTDFYGGKTYSTQLFNADKWTVAESSSQLVDLGIILDKLNSGKKVEKIDENHFRVKLSKRDLNGMLTHDSTDVDVIVGSVYVDVYTNNGYIEKLDYDFSKALMKTFGNIQISMTFSDFDMAGDVLIPQEIINTASTEYVSVPTDIDSIGEFVEDNPSFFDTLIDIFGQ
ncbi:MAG: hypothetical protein IJ346_01525 [Clostridia bacterium]|nr:hypothetical protein [Clostridia bacterium]